MTQILFLLLSTYAVAQEPAYRPTHDSLENDFVYEQENASYAREPIGALDDERDRRLGPWLSLSQGGFAIGDPQGKIIKNPDGTETNTYGSLENGTLLRDSGDGFKRISSASTNYGAGHMISLLENSSAAFHELHPEVTVRIGGISLATGGHFPPHQSHQNGLDADILFIGRANWDSVLDKEKKVTDRFDLEKNWQFWRSLVNQRIVAGKEVESVVSMILVAPEIKTHLCEWAKAGGALGDPLNREVMRRVRPTEGHDGHFHLRLRCSPYHTACKRTYGAPRETGCEAPQ